MMMTQEDIREGKMAVVKNQFKLMGRVGKYSKENVINIKYFDNGKCCAQIRLGVKSGEKWENHFITFWNTEKNKTAEQVAESLSEGDYVQVIGRIKLQEFIPESMKGQLDANGQQKKIQRVDLIGTSYKPVHYNQDLEEFEFAEV